MSQTAGKRARNLAGKKSRKKKGAKKLSRGLVAKQNWPIERDVLMRPDRLKYVRKLVRPRGCVFCTAARSGPSLSSLCLYRGKKAMVVLNKYPYNNGHLLVLPIRHCGDLIKLNEAEYLEVHWAIKKCVSVLRKAYQPNGINVGLNLGKGAGAGIPEHLHYHVIPRWVGDTNFFPLIAETKVVIETLEQSYARLLPLFNATYGAK